MDRRERFSDSNTMLLTALAGWQAGLWTALPGIIQSFDPVKKTVVVQPAIQGKVQSQDGSFKWVNMPLFLDVPVHFPSGGGFTLTFPIKAGDECLVVFSSRCIDAWWQLGGIQPQLELRNHDLSDGIAFVGISSVPKVQPNISITATQLRSDDGGTYVEVGLNSTVRVEADHIESHAKVSYVWDVYGYGQKITYTGGNNYTIDNYNIGANVTVNNHNINQPDAT